MFNNHFRSMKQRPSVRLTLLALLSLLLNGLTTALSQIESPPLESNGAFAQSLSSARQVASATAPSTEINARAWRNIVTLIGLKADGQSFLIGGGFFVDPWTIVTNYYLVEEALDKQARAIVGVSLDRKAKYTVINLLADKERRLIFLDVREKGPQPLPINTDGKMKNGDKVYLANQAPPAAAERLKQDNANSPSAVTDLLETSTPIPPEYSGQPALDQTGRVIGVVVDSRVKAAPANGVLPAKHLITQLKNYLNYPGGPNTKTAPNVEERLPASPAADSPTAEREAGGQSAWQLTAPSTTGDTSHRDSGGTARPVSIGALQGKAQRRVQPVYPPAAKAERVSGAVQVQIVINEQGEVTQAEIVSGHQLLRLASLRAARQWIFAPTIVAGATVKVQGPLTFNFTLQ